jgi:hypothetical protein
MRTARLSHVEFLAEDVTVVTVPLYPYETFFYE